MERPVMTSASSHRLRSAVGACAQPTHSYLSAPYLSSSSIQVESQNTGGCFKKFNESGKNCDNSLLNITRKPHSSSDFSFLHKRHKINNKHNLHHQRSKKNEKEAENSSNNDILSLIPKQLMLGNDFLSKLKLNRKLLEPKKLADYLNKTSRNDSVINCEKVIGTKSINKNKKTANNGTCISINGSNSTSSSNSAKKTLNHRHSCNKGNSKKSTNLAKKDSTNVESEHSDEYSKCGVVHLNEGIRSERQEISKWKPKHVMTRRTAQIVRDIRNACQSRVGSSKSVPSEDVRCFLNFLQVSQVNEILDYAKECTGIRSAKSEPTDFIELSRVPNDRIKTNKLCKVTSIPRILDKNEEKQARKPSKGMSKYEVFLGGSCNPTTWRTDFAIPELKKMGISYYNPQVKEWRPELMEVEYYAKENATVMFFVLDNQTRGVSALIEVAHLAGNGRNLILVIQSYAQKNQIICDEEITDEEYEDLKRGQEVLQLLVQRQGIPVFDNIQVALESTKKILRENLRVQDLQTPVHMNRENSISPRDVFEKLDSRNSGQVSAGDACLALKMFTGVKVSMSDLKNLIYKTGKELNGTVLSDVKFDFERFSELAVEFKRQLGDKIPLDSSPLSIFCCKDIYLGGTTENTSWRESIAIPALEEQNLSYFVPKISEGGKRFSDIEAASMDNSFVLLFVITNTARSVAAMAIAGHYIKKDANVVLCVEHLPENATIGEEKLSESAVKDYNRGRMYLMDIAERNRVPVLHDILTAVKSAIKKCRNR